MPISRRDLLRVAAVVAAPAALPTALRAGIPDAEWTADALTRLAERPRILAADERATISAIADAIIPRSETPGALEIGATDFIELLLAEWLPESEAISFREGVAALDARVRELYGAAWPALDR
ncbi:MAG TPA: gluconate 2-dehydrogenase subunit 3 family protein, partial [Gemmatimonadaceae bacterium]|nr:gluconate 2-dehydrogenase subunit 3 family protein [Gemmatimonadaceae bacterium]